MNSGWYAGEEEEHRKGHQSSDFSYLDAISQLLSVVIFQVYMSDSKSS